jgi:hypothetical protein
MRAWLVALVLVAGLAPQPAAAHQGAPMWTLAKVMRNVQGARIHIGGRVLRVDAGSTLCSGDGPAVRWGGIGHWRHFTCTWTTFDARRQVDRDITFRVHTLMRVRMLITNVRYGAV